MVPRYVQVIIVLFGIVLAANFMLTVNISNRVNKLETISIPLPPQQSNEGTAQKTKYIKVIVNRYKVNESMVSKVVKYANDYAYDTFPKAKDIIAIVGIESSWNPSAKSNLKHDPAIGLTQIRPGKWTHLYDAKEISKIENQIKWASQILHHNYEKTGNIKDAVIAYNIGLSARLRGRDNERYYIKFIKEHNMLAENISS